MLDETFIDAIAEHTPDAVKAEVIRPQAEPPHAYWLHNRKTGDLTRHEAPPTPRRDAARTLSGVAEAVAHHFATAQEHDRAIVAIGETDVVFLPERNGHRRVTMRTPLSEQFRVVTSSHLEGIDQKKLDWTLRTVFKDQVAPSNFAHTIRQLKFQDNTNGQSVISHGKESMGATIEREVSGAAEIPDEITFVVPVYEGVFWGDEEFYANVKCAVHIDTAEKKFTIRPLAGEISRARAEARSWIRSMLDDAFVSRGIQAEVTVLPDLDIF